MALYYDAVKVLTDDSGQGSLKSRIYSGSFNLQSKPSQVYALISECAKYDTLLKEVIDNAGLLEEESKLSPLLSLLLVHDHLFAKGGIAASSSHALTQSIERHKARLRAELTKARLRRKCESVVALKQEIEKGARAGQPREQPRWVRINTLKTTAQILLEGPFKGCKAVSRLPDVLQAGRDIGVYHEDHNVPNLWALPPGVDLTQNQAYGTGGIVLQDKASCFPAHLLLGSLTVAVDGFANPDIGDIVDACAAPGNKTTHLAAVVASIPAHCKGRETKIFACERDLSRSKVLQNMVDKAGAANVGVLHRQDFLALDPCDLRFAKVTHLLLDPSCSGSGIVGREDVPVLELPSIPSQTSSKLGDTGRNETKSKKRKRSGGTVAHDVFKHTNKLEVKETCQKADRTRLERLSNLQLRIIEHAFAFPAATHVSYSTCSVHAQENEDVVARALRSQISRTRRWRLLRRQQQVEGMRRWPHRGTLNRGDAKVEDSKLTDEELDACIRCYPDDEEGTMGFFVCCFVRDDGDGDEDGDRDRDGDGEWSGFSDNG